MVLIYSSISGVTSQNEWLQKVLTYLYYSIERHYGVKLIASQIQVLYAHIDRVIKIFYFQLQPQ